MERCLFPSRKGLAAECVAPDTRQREIKILKMLSQHDWVPAVVLQGYGVILRRLARQGIVEKRSVQGMPKAPPHVEYRIAASGRMYLKALGEDVR